MNADDARKITNENLRGPAIDNYVKALNLHIEEAAKQGKSSIDPTLVFGSRAELRDWQRFRSAIIRHFVGNGFEWIDHPDPDPGHPASRSYTTLSW